MSPEQARGATIDPRSDIFVLGASLFTILTGSAPYTGDTAAEVLTKAAKGQVHPPRSLDRHIPRLLNAICLKAMASNREDRYQSSRELGNEVRKWLGD
jgi:serine/threonine protein kinase